MLTKGAIGNLVNRYRAVLTKCNLINTFGSLAVASMLVLGGAGVAGAEDIYLGDSHTLENASAGDKLFGGAKDESVGDVSITIPSSFTTKLDSIWGGGRASKRDAVAKAGDVVITINADAENTVLNGDIFGGGHAYSGTDAGEEPGTAEVNDVTINLNSGRIEGTVFGGGSAEGYTSATSKVNGKTIINLDGATVTEAIVGGSRARRLGDANSMHNFVATSQDVEINIKKGSVNGIVGGGVVTGVYYNNSNTPLQDLNISSTVKDIVINVYDGVVNKLSNENDKAGVSIDNSNVNAAIVGGGVISLRGIDSMNFKRNVDTGNVSINIFGGTIYGDIVGGNILEGGDATDTSSVDSVKVNMTGGKVEGSIYTGNLVTEGAKLSDTGVPDVVVTLGGDAEVTGSLVAGDATVEESSGEVKTSSNSASTTVVLDSTQVKLGQGIVRASANVTVGATGNFNDECASSDEALNKLAEITNVQSGEALSVAEGDINGAAVLNADGSKQVSRNTLMDDALTMASIATVSLDRILTNDVRKRLGDIRADQNTTGVWMRWDGGKLKGDSGLTNNFNTIQIGGDTKAAKNCRIGFAGSFTHGDTEFSRGNGELEGFSFALYGTWMGENGMFADVVARLGKFSTEMHVDGMKGDMDNRVASLSGEYGWRLPVCQQFFVEPQVELAYTYVSSDDLQLGDNHYEFDNVDSLTGRAGVVAGWQLSEERGNVYARASVVQQFMGDAKISGTKGIAHNVQEIDGEDTWLEYGIGANVKLTDSTYLWADVERTEGADIEEEWRGTVGVRFSF